MNKNWDISWVRCIAWKCRAVVWPSFWSTVLSNSRALIPNPSVFSNDWLVEIHGYNIWNVHNKSNQTVGWFGWIPQSQRLIIWNCYQLSWIWPKKDIRYYKLAFFHGALSLQAIHVPKKNSLVMSGTRHWLECGTFILHYHQTHAGYIYINSFKICLYFMEHTRIHFVCVEEV